MPPFYGFQPTDGLHVLKDHWCQKSHLGLQSQNLVEHLCDAIQATYAAAHERHQGFQLDRIPGEVIAEAQRERSLEAAMLVRWNQPDLWQIPGGWSRLVAYQVPLFRQQDREQWGYIDLIGVNQKCLPVVVELKDSPPVRDNGTTGGTESPLRIVLEAASYGISLRKNWPWFREEWLTHLRKLGYPDDFLENCPNELSTVPLVAAAPASYWLEWLPVTAKGINEVTRDDWRHFSNLIAELGKKELPVRFLSISGSAAQPSSLAVQPLLDHIWQLQY